MAGMIDSMWVTLIREALRVREYSFSPISGFAAGTALLEEDRAIYCGYSIGCVRLTPSSCTERTTFFKAVNEDCLEFRAITIVGGPKRRPLAGYCPPCGTCRQLMAQSCSLGTSKIIMAVDETDWKKCTLGELLLMAFQRFNPDV